MEKTNRTRRRKGRRRPPTVGRNCRWLFYSGGVAVCGLKTRQPGRPVAGALCDKRRGCGYEEEPGAVSRLMEKILKKGGR